MGSRKGTVTELKVCAKLMEMGARILHPVDVEKYDLAIHTNKDRLCRVQIKTGYMQHNCLVAHACSTNIGEYAGHADIFIIYSPDLDEYYCYPVMAGMPSKICLGLPANKRKTFPAEDFKLTKELLDEVTNAYS